MNIQLKNYTSGLTYPTARVPTITFFKWSEIFIYDFSFLKPISEKRCLEVAFPVFYKPEF